MAAEGADISSRDLQCQPASAPAFSPGFGGAFFPGAPTAAFVGAFLGCLATLHLSAYGFIPAIASALATTLLCGAVLVTRTTSLFSSEFFAAIYGGTFAGMTPVLWLSDPAPERSVMLVDTLFILLPIVCGLAFCIVAEIETRSGGRLAGGYGGRSGAIAAVASFLFVHSAPLFGADDTLFQSAHVGTSDVDLRLAAFTCATCMIGISVTLLVLRRSRVASAGTAHRTLLASAVALMGLTALHLARPDDTHALDAFYAGCFVGMSTPERLKGWIQPLLGAIVLSIVLVQVRTLFPGVGGGLGFAAFVTVAVLAALSRAATWLTHGILTHDRRPETATQASASGSLVPLSTRAGANVRFVSGAARAVAIVGSMAIGWLVLADPFASEEAALDMAASARPAEQSAPMSAKTTLGMVDNAMLPGTPAANVINTDLRAVTGVPPKPDVTALSHFGGAAVVTAGLGRADRAGGEASDTKTAQSGVRIGAVRESEKKIFREYLRWRAARAARIAQARPQAAKRSQDRPLQPVRLTRASASPPARSERARQPDRPN